jgi:hypothetical protein
MFSLSQLNPPPTPDVPFDDQSWSRQPHSCYELADWVDKKVTNFLMQLLTADESLEQPKIMHQKTPSTQALNVMRLLNYSSNCPRFSPRNWTAFLNLDCIARFSYVSLVMCMVLVRANNNLAVQRVTYATFNQYGDSFVHLVRDNHTN